MTPEAALIDLLERVSARRGAAVLVSAEELCQWPATAVTAMKSQKLLARARPAKSVICPGCERACAMPVHTVAASNRVAGSFVVCDKRDDINRVPISASLLKQWRCDSEALCDFIAASIAIRRSKERSGNDSLIFIGMMAGDKRRQMLSLRFDGRVSLVAGDRSERLSDLIGFDRGQFNIDAKVICGMVDRATTPDPTYTLDVDRREDRKLETQAMYEGWKKAYRELKKQSPNMTDVWYSRRIARTPDASGRSPDTIRKHMIK